MEFLENLTKLLEERHETKSGLARNIGVTESAVRQWYQGRMPTIDKVVKISQYFSISISELLGIKEENELIAIYGKLSPEDKAIVDIIFNKYRELDQTTSSTSKIG